MSSTVMGIVALAIVAVALAYFYFRFRDRRPKRTQATAFRHGSSDDLHLRWAKWVVEAALPIAPFLVLLLVRTLPGGDPSIEPKPLLWNAEIPFFTWVLGAFTIMKALKLARMPGYGFVVWVALGTGVVTGVATFLMGSFYFDENVRKLPHSFAESVAYVHTMLAVVQLIIGAVVEQLTIRTEASAATGPPPPSRSGQASEVLPGSSPSPGTVTT